MQQVRPDVSELWIQHQRRYGKATSAWACILCPDRRIFPTVGDLKKHARAHHSENLPTQDRELEAFLESYVAESAMKRPSKDSPQPWKPLSEATTKTEPHSLHFGRTEHSLDHTRNASTPPTRSISNLGDFPIGTPGGGDEVAIRNLSEDKRDAEVDWPEKPAALSDGISTGLASPYRDSSSSAPPRRPHARPSSPPYGSSVDPDNLPRDMLDTSDKAHVGKSQLWAPDQEPPLTKASFNDPSNIASMQAQKSRAQGLQVESRQPSETPQILSARPQSGQNNPNSPPLIQPFLETSIISKEQLAVELKAMHAGLHMFAHAGRKTHWTRGSSKSKGRSRAWRQGDPFPTTLNVQRQENKRKVLRIHIEGEEQLCCPDSGSSKNIMSKAFAKEKEFAISRRCKDIMRFELGNGKKVWSIGRVYVSVKVPGLSLSQRRRSFYVFEDCPVPVVLGMDFLEEAGILNTNRHLLEPCPDNWINISRFLWIGTPRNRMNCSLDGHNLVAVADTGSDLNLMSLDCAKREGFDVDTRPEVRRKVQVGDSSEVETIGRVYVYSMEFDWRKPETHSPAPKTQTASNSPSESKPSIETSLNDEEVTIFEVIEGMPSDVVLGRGLLEATNAFSGFPDLFNRPRRNKNSLNEFNVYIDRGPLFTLPRFLQRRRKEPAAIPETREQHNEKKREELCRRAQEEERIALLPQDEQGLAKALEQRRVRSWIKLHDTCEHCHQA